MTLTTVPLLFTSPTSKHYDLRVCLSFVHTLYRLSASHLALVLMIFFLLLLASSQEQAIDHDTPTLSLESSILLKLFSADYMS